MLRAVHQTVISLNYCLWFDHHNFHAVSLFILIIKFFPCTHTSHEAVGLFIWMLHSTELIMTQHPCMTSEAQMKVSVPNEAVLRRAPEGVGPHGSRCDALDAVGVVWEHVSGLLRRQVVHVHLGVGGSCDQDPVLGVRQELQTHTFTDEDTRSDMLSRCRRGLHLHWEDVGCVSRVHSDELGVPERIPDDGVLVIRTRGQEAGNNKHSEFMKRHGDVKNSGIEDWTYSPLSFHSRQLTQPEWPWNREITMHEQS